mgnify:FL=1|jgi:hypothetical protein|tara:strand:- start:614 stop:946 length:333 start_codon:yes stop_codon:yes gene_type:complete
MAKTLNIAQRNLTALKKSTLDDFTTTKDYQHAINAIDASIKIYQAYKLHVLEHAHKNEKAAPIFVNGRTTVPLDKLKKAAEKFGFNWDDPEYVNKGDGYTKLKLIDDGSM